MDGARETSPERSKDDSGSDFNHPPASGGKEDCEPDPGSDKAGIANDHEGYDVSTEAGGKSDPERNQRGVPQSAEDAERGKSGLKRELGGTVEPGRKRQRTLDNGLESSSGPDEDVDIKQESSKAAAEEHVEDGEEDEDMASQQTSAKIKDDVQPCKSSGQDSLPQTDEPRRALRGAGKKSAPSRQLNSKNFLKMVLPNITRLSRTEILQDLRVCIAYLSDAVIFPSAIIEFHPAMLSHSLAVPVCFRLWRHMPRPSNAHNRTHSLSIHWDGQPLGEYSAKSSPNEASRL